MCSKAFITWFTFNLFEVCQEKLNDAPQMGGIAELVQIDECLFRGKRNSNRARLLLANRDNNNKNNINGLIQYSNSSDDWDTSDDTTQTNNNRNYETRVDGETFSNYYKCFLFLLRSRDFWHCRRRRGTLFSCRTSWCQYFTCNYLERCLSWKQNLVRGMESLHTTYIKRLSTDKIWFIHVLPVWVTMGPC